MASLDCRGTPISIPQGFDLSGIPVDKATRLRLIAPKFPPTGPVAALPDGLNLNENTQIELHLSDSRKSASGYRYSLIDSRLTFPAIHNLTGGLPRAELCLYFRNQALNLTSKIVCICLGLALGMDNQAPYFTALSASAPMPQRPPLTSLFESDDTFIEYVGADLRGRTLTTPNPSSKCDPVLQKVTYFVCVGQGFIGSQATLARLIGLAGTGLIGPVKQTIKTLPSDLIKYASLVYGIRLGPDSGSGTAGTPTPTSALKCYRIDPSKDIKNGTINLNEPSDGTLADEVVASQIAQDAALPAGATSGFQPGDAETYIAITVAVILGICLVLYLLNQFYPGGLGQFAGNTAAAAGVAGSAIAGGAVVAGSAIGSGAVVAGSAIASGARTAGSAIGRGAVLAGSTIGSGASAAASGIASGASAAASGIASVASATSSAIGSGILGASTSIGRMGRGPIPFATSTSGPASGPMSASSAMHSLAAGTVPGAQGEIDEGAASSAGASTTATATSTPPTSSSAGASTTATAAPSGGGSQGSWFPSFGRRKSPFTPPSPPGAPGLTRPSIPDEPAMAGRNVENANPFSAVPASSPSSAGLGGSLLAPPPTSSSSSAAPVVTSSSATPAPSSGGAGAPAPSAIIGGISATAAPSGGISTTAAPSGGISATAAPSGGGGIGSWFPSFGRRKSPFTPPSPPGAPGLTRPSIPDEPAMAGRNVENANPFSSSSAAPVVSSSPIAAPGGGGSSAIAAPKPAGGGGSTASSAAGSTSQPPSSSSTAAPLGYTLPSDLTSAPPNVRDAYMRMAHAVSSSESTNPTNRDLVQSWRNSQTASSIAAPPPSSAAPTSGISSWLSSFFGGGGSSAASHKDLYQKVFQENDKKVLDYLKKELVNPARTITKAQIETAIKELEGRQSLTESSTLPINSPSLIQMRESAEVDRITKEATEAAEKTSAAVASFVASGVGGGGRGKGKGGGGGGSAGGGGGSAGGGGGGGGSVVGGGKSAGGGGNAEKLTGLKQKLQQTEQGLQTMKKVTNEYKQKQRQRELERNIEYLNKQLYKYLHYSNGTAKNEASLSTKDKDAVAPLQKLLAVKQTELAKILVPK